MTTELVLLLGLFVFILGGAFLGDKGPRKVFENAAPRLGARVERNITFGHKHRWKGAPSPWRKPNGAAPTGSP